MKQQTNLPGRRWRRWAAIAVAAVLVLGLAGEIVLRAFPEWSPEARARARLYRAQPSRTSVTKRIEVQQIASLGTYVPDPYLGALLAPSLHDTVRTPDYTYTRHTDHAGFANREPWPERVDVVVLGSSLIMGPGVGLDGQFTSLLDRRLGSHTVLNLGVPGGGPELEWRVATRFAEPFQPKLVVLALWLASDIGNARRFEHWITESPEQGFTDFRFQYRSTHGDAQSTPPVRDFLSRSAVVRAIYFSMKAALTRESMRERVLFPDGDTIYLSVRVQHRLARGIDRADTPNLRQAFFGPLERLQRRLEARGGRFLVVLLPSKEEIYGAGRFPAVLTAVEEARGELQEREIPFLDLYETFRRRGQSVSPFFPTDIHYNELGNDIISDAIEAWIKDQKVFGRLETSTAVQ